VIDFRDLCIQELADGEAALRDHVVSLHADVDSYRLLVQVLLEELVQLTARLRHAQRVIRQLRRKTT
jgi:hypothetical protein